MRPFESLETRMDSGFALEMSQNGIKGILFATDQSRNVVYNQQLRFRLFFKATNLLNMQ
jgi:hypothetical protein